MKKIEEYADFIADTSVPLAVYEVVTAFHKASADGCKTLLFSPDTYLNFIRGFSDQIPSETDVSSGQFVFWGVAIFRE